MLRLEWDVAAIDKLILYDIKLGHCYKIAQDVESTFWNTDALLIDHHFIMIIFSIFATLVFIFIHVLSLRIRLFFMDYIVVVVQIFEFSSQAIRGKQGQVNKE